MLQYFPLLIVPPSNPTCNI